MIHETNSLPSYFQHHELEVAAILLHLPPLIKQSSSPFSWSSKRKRSSLSRGVIDSLPLPALSSSPSLSDAPPAALNASLVQGDSKAVSPNTPLSLNLSAEESGEKPAPTSKRSSSVKRSREDWKEKLAESEKQGRILRKEIESVRSYYNILIEENLRLKAVQHQLSLREEQRRIRIAETQLAESRKDSAFMVVNEKGFDQAICSYGCSCSGSGNGSGNNDNGRGIDLNSESGGVHGCFPVDGRSWQRSTFGDFLRRGFDDWGLRMATAAEARKRRIHMMKEKEQRRLGVNSKRKKFK
ncbi:hypothetical protein LINPERPRIM_LOCUS32603 [Linum perenne]